MTATTVAVPERATGLEVRDVPARLAPERRAVLVLRAIWRISVEETAEAIGVAVCKSRRSRAKVAFRTRWTV